MTHHQLQTAGTGIREAHNPVLGEKADGNVAAFSVRSLDSTERWTFPRLDSRPEALSIFTSLRYWSRPTYQLPVWLGKYGFNVGLRATTNFQTLEERLKLHALAQLISERHVEAASGVRGFV